MKLKINGQSWVLFFPRSDGGDGCRVFNDETRTPSKQRGIRFMANRVARFGIKPWNDVIRVKRGQHYRLAAWIKAEDDLSVQLGQPGIVLRATLFGGQAQLYVGPNYYVGLRGVCFGAPERLAVGRIPREWSKIEGVIEIPEGVEQMKFFVFCWFAHGSFCIDMPTIERVADSTPLTRLIGI